MSEKRQSQEDRLLDFLRLAVIRSKVYGGEGWVTLPQIMTLRIASHSKIFSNLYKRGERDGFKIEIERKHEYGQLLTRYRLVQP